MDRPFIKGLDLCGLFYDGAVKPILARHFPNLAYSAALLGQGSEVLGLDDTQSRDHDWGPRLMLFLTEADCQAHRADVDRVLRAELPAEVHGYPTRFRPNDDGTATAAASEGGGCKHGVKILTASSFFRYVLGFDPMGDIRAIDWLSIPEYRLLMLTAGRVYHDGLGQLEPVRARLAYYPHDVWLYLLAAQWRRIAQEEAFMGRCGQVGDDLGSRLVAARLVQNVLRLCFLMERQYAPYIKWLGSTFARLRCAARMAPILTAALAAGNWQEREEHFSAAYEAVAQMHNALAITAPLPEHVSQFHSRPFRVIHADRFVDAIRAAIQSAEVRALPAHLGSVDQFLDSTDAQAFLDRFRTVFA